MNADAARATLACAVAKAPSFHALRTKLYKSVSKALNTL